MPTWTVALHGAVADLEPLAGLEAGVTQEGAGFVFRSPELDSMTDAIAVHGHVVEQVEMLQGLMRIVAGDQKIRPIKVGGIVRDGGQAQFVIATPIAIRIHIVDTKGPTTHRKLAAIAGRDPKIREALRWLSGKPSAANLYKCYEVLVGAVGKRQIIGKRWSSKTELSRFTYNVNKERHSVPKAGRRRRKPPDPMSVPEAQEFLRNLVLKWLASK
jgi:hypothetical protein